MSAAGSDTSGTVRWGLLPCCQDGRGPRARPPPLAACPSCQTTSLPYSMTSLGLGTTGVVPPTVVTNGDAVIGSTPRFSFGESLTRGPKSPDAMSTVFPRAAAWRKSRRACLMNGADAGDGMSTTERLMTLTSGMATRSPMASTSDPPLTASTMPAPGATAPAQLTSRMASSCASVLEVAGPASPTFSRSSGGRSKRSRNAVTSSLSTLAAPTMPMRCP